MATTKDELWSLGQRSRGLTEFLSELRIIWNDSAAHEISTRYLVPRSDDDQRMQRALADQQNALEELQSHVATVMELASAAEGLSQNIAQLLRETLQEVSTANGYYQSFSEFNNAANNLFPVIEERVSQANSSCTGIVNEGTYNSSVPDVSDIEAQIAANGSWSSPSGLLYESIDRFQHVLEHAQNDLTKPKHGVFFGGESGALSTIDKAWSMRGNSDVVVVSRGARSVYYVPMGENIGYFGGIIGSQQGNPATSWVQIVARTGSSNIVTAFPVLGPPRR
jgi:hypothetical protein